MRVLIISDIHGNLNALNAISKKAAECEIDGCAILGDLIDYGMRSNEAVSAVKSLPFPVLCNIYGNHERAIINADYERFSSERGRDSARYTRSVLTADTTAYIKTGMTAAGVCEFSVSGKKCLAVHGSLKDVFWKSISPSDIDLSDYSEYDYVFSGHSHLPHFFERYFDADDKRMRNKKKTVFINPGSVGQPRNHNNKAQFAVLDTDTEELTFHKVAYDIAGEQALYCGQVDEFYKTRLEDGI